MKYERTEDKNIKRNSKSRTLYFRRGKAEISLKTTDFAQAQIRKQLILADIEFAGETSFRNTVAEIYPVYLELKTKQSKGLVAKKKRLAKGTFKEITYVFNQHLLPFFGDTKIGKITPGLWEKYTDRSTVSDLANHRKVLLGFLKWCVVREYLKQVPGPLPLPHHERRRRRIIKPVELEKIFEHATGSLLLFLSLALYKGLRRTEIMTLTIAGVNTEERHLTIYKGFNKKRRERSLPINQIVADLLKSRIVEIQKLGIKTAWIFPNAVDPKRPAHPDGLKTAWHTVLKKAGLTDITWHDFRATFEKHMNMSKEFSDVQKEKFADASMDVQKSIYVSMDHADLRGLEKSVDLPALDKIIKAKVAPMGKLGELK